MASESLRYGRSKKRKDLKKAEERWAEWEDRQRLERQGDEIMEVLRRHGKEEDASGGRDDGRDKYNE